MISPEDRARQLFEQQLATDGFSENGIEQARGSPAYRAAIRAIQSALSTPTIGEAREALELARVREALTPWGETKADYSGEFSWTEWLPDENGIEQGHERVVPWPTIKEIMAAIRQRAGVERLDESDCETALSPIEKEERGS